MPVAKIQVLKNTEKSNMPIQILDCFTYENYVTLEPY